MKNKDDLSFEKVSAIYPPFLSSWLTDHSSHKQVQSESQIYIAYDQGRPFGYIKSYPIDVSHRYAKYCRPDGITIGIDVYIPDLNFLKNRYSSEILRQFIAQLGPDVDRVIADPPIESRINSFFQEYGFKEMEKLFLERKITVF